LDFVSSTGGSVFAFGAIKAFFKKTIFQGNLRGFRERRGGNPKEGKGISQPFGHEKKSANKAIIINKKTGGHGTNFFHFFCPGL